MPISLADFQQDRATVDVRTRLGVIKVVYRPHVMTVEKEAQLAAMMLATDDDDDPDHVIQERKWAMAEQFCQVVESVDITGPMYDGDGNQIVGSDELIPIRPDCVVKLPTGFFNRTFTAIRLQAEEEDEEYSKSSSSGEKSDRNSSRRGSRGR